LNAYILLLLVWHAAKSDISILQDSAYRPVYRAYGIVPYVFICPLCIYVGLDLADYSTRAARPKLRPIAGRPCNF